MMQQYGDIKVGDSIKQSGFVPAMSILEKDKIYIVEAISCHHTLPDLKLNGVKDWMSCTNFKRI